MKIRKVTFNNRRRVFEVTAGRRSYIFAYSRTRPTPSPGDRVRAAIVDEELGREAFTCQLESGEEGSVHLDHVLEYNEDPDYLRDLLLYKLTLEVQDRVKKASQSRREIIRRLGTSATQFYRLLDQTNYTKSVDQMLALLHVLDCDAKLIVKDRVAHSA